MANRPSKPTDQQPDLIDEADDSPAVLALTPERLRNATGTDEPSLQPRLLQQAMDASWLGKGEVFDDAVMTALVALEAIGPRDGVEGMLATQMVGTHEAAMECLRRAMISEQTFEGRDANLKHAAKLLQIYARQVEALDKHRGKGQQKITVEHVTVEAGGQAIVGNLHAPVGKNITSPQAQRALSDQSAQAVDVTDLAGPRTAQAKQRVKRER